MGHPLLGEAESIELAASAVPGSWSSHGCRHYQRRTRANGRHSHLTPSVQRRAKEFLRPDPQRAGLVCPHRTSPPAHSQCRPCRSNDWCNLRTAVPVTRLSHCFYPAGTNGSRAIYGFKAQPFADEVLVYELEKGGPAAKAGLQWGCLLYTSPSPRDLSTSRMPSSA